MTLESLEFLISMCICYSNIVISLLSIRCILVIRFDSDDIRSRSSWSMIIDTDPETILLNQTRSVLNKRSIRRGAVVS